MCRNIRVLYNFEPPTTREEVHAAALQFVRKVTGLNKPSAEDAHAFDHAVDHIAEHTAELLSELHARTAVKTREGEKDKARARWKQREKRLAGDPAGG
jgi:hypothetical protein